MSKKTNKVSADQHTFGHASTAEYAVIQHDLVRVILLNIVYLGAVLAVYFVNRQNHFLDNWFAQTFHF